MSLAIICIRVVTVSLLNGIDLIRLRPSVCMTVETTSWIAGRISCSPIVCYFPAFAISSFVSSLFWSCCPCSTRVSQVNEKFYIFIWLVTVTRFQLIDRSWWLHSFIRKNLFVKQAQSHILYNQRYIVWIFSNLTNCVQWWIPMDSWIPLLASPYKFFSVLQCLHKLSSFTYKSLSPNIIYRYHYPYPLLYSIF